MTLSAALPSPGAALRVVRTAAGRRALQLALLVSGLFALGLLGEGQAHAASGTPVASPAPVTAGHPSGPARFAGDAVRRVEGAVGVVAGQTARGPHEPTVAHRGHPATALGPRATANPTGTAPAARPSAPGRHRPSLPGRHRSSASVVRTGAVIRPASARLPAVSGISLDGTVHRVVRPVAEGPLRPLGGEVIGSVRTVGRVAAAVTGGLVNVPSGGAALPQLPPLPSTPSVPSAPSVPSPAEPPSGPRAPGSWSSPVGTGPAAQRQKAGAHGPRGGPVARGASGSAHGAAHSVPTARARLTAAAGPSCPSPVRRACDTPDGNPTGVLGDETAAGEGVPGHGAAWAVALKRWAPLPLVRGATVFHAAGEARDRHRGIPVFPG
ncbi:hypothetical protein ABZ845_05055 [Streptomyces sp. NPDC047022]|uniref:hypothetical protein n=1 Tax=Streptomyces sp. NPDC047022 TaxID=3155737 RepID=UPI0033C0B261